MVNVRVPVSILILSAALLACNPVGSTPTPETDQGINEQDSMATYISATLAASGYEENVNENPEPAIEEAIPVSTDTPIPSTPDTPTTSQPELTICYILDDDVWLWGEETGGKQLTTSGNIIDVSLSDDGSRIAFVRQLDDYYQELWTVFSDGTNEEVLVSRADFEAIPRGDDYYITTQPYQFDWIPGKHTLAFNTSPIGDGPGLLLNNDLYTINVETGILTPLLAAGFGGMFHYSPDGDQIAVVTPKSLSLVNLDGSNRRDALTFPLIYTYSEWSFYPTPVWAPDSSYLRVAVPPQDPLSFPTALTYVYHILLDGKMPYTTGEFVSAPVFRGESIISPDTLKLVYALPIGDSLEQFELHYLELDTYSDTVYATAATFPGKWSPDSTQFTYMLADNQSIYIGQMGVDPIPAANTENVYEPIWVDDSQIIFYAKPSPETGFFLHLGKAGGTSEVISGPFDHPVSYDYAK